MMNNEKGTRLTIIMHLDFNGEVTKMYKVKIVN